MADTEATALVRQLRDALRHIDAALDPDDWAGEQRMLDITRPAIATADEWLSRQRGPLADEQNSADAARWREMRRVFHVAEHIGATTGMPATKLSCHWYGWASGNHADVTGCVDALISERCHSIGLPTVEDRPC